MSSLNLVNMIIIISGRADYLLEKHNTYNFIAPSLNLSNCTEFLTAAMTFCG